MSGKSDDSVLMVFIIAIALGVAYGIWKISQFLGVDFATAVRVVALSVGAVIAYGALLKFEVLHFGGSWHYLLAAEWASFWPALNYRAAEALPWDDAPAWYATWYGELGILAAIVVGGYFVNKARDR